ncbi:MAG TPA: hypothetical protein ENN69_03945 [Spirochaetia bacterium]|nr:hypothetical protein [Spirochaetia bacterium]
MIRRAALIAMVVWGMPTAVFLSADLACINHPARDGDIVFVGPIASSTLFEGDDPETFNTEKYGIQRAFDGDVRTVWAEGEEGPGIGVEISFALPRTASRLTIVNGYAASPTLFRANNRVRELTVEIRMGIMTDVDQCAEIYTTRLISRTTLQLADTAQAQTFAIDLSDPRLANEMEAFQDAVFADGSGNEYLRSMLPIFIGLLTIESVYPGNRWDDTCLAEIRVD